MHCDSEMLAAFLYTEGVQILVGAIELLGAPSGLKVKPLWDPEYKSCGKFMIREYKTFILAFIYSLILNILISLSQHP